MIILNCLMIDIKNYLYIYSKLIKQGFWYTQLCYLKKSFPETHSKIFSKYNYGVSKHITEGICLPVTVRAV